MAASQDYVLGGTLTEQQRLLKQCQGFEREARWLLNRVGVKPGWRVIDVGSGPLGILDLLAERVGPTGEVIGFEREPRFVAMAQGIIGERQLPNVSMVLGDAHAPVLPKGSFDFVHERLVLLQTPRPEQMLAEIVALARPGGIVAVEDIDQVSWLCYPPHPAWAPLLEAFHIVCRNAGVDLYIGRRLPELLRGAGLTDVNFEVHVRADHHGEYRRTHLLSLIESTRNAILERGLFSEGELTELMDALWRHLDNPHTIVVRELLFQAWGRKPPVSA